MRRLPAGALAVMMDAITPRTFYHRVASPANPAAPPQKPRRVEASSGASSRTTGASIWSTGA